MFSIFKSSVKSVLFAGIAAAGLTTTATTASAQEPFVGEIRNFGFNFCPRGWSETAGQIIAISSNTALFSLLGTTFGGDGRTTFGLPDLRGRSAIGMGTGPGLSAVAWGQKGGAETHTMTVNEMPSHSHDLRAFNGEGDQRRPSGDVIAQPKSSTGDDIMAFYDQAPDTLMDSTSIGPTGNNIAFKIRDPFLGNKNCIAMFGIYPSRN